MPSASARIVSDGDERRLDGQPQRVLQVGTQRVPEHEMSPGRFVQVRPVVRPEEDADDGGPAFGEAADRIRVPRVPKVPRVPRCGCQRCLGCLRCARCQGALEVGPHLVAEPPAERARVGEQRDAEEQRASRADSQQLARARGRQLAGQALGLGARDGDAALGQLVIPPPLVVVARVGPLVELLDQAAFEQPRQRAIERARDAA